MADPVRVAVVGCGFFARNHLFSWKDLAGESMIGFEAGSAVREVIDRASSAAGVRLEVVMELRSIESIKQMVAAGIGVGFVSRFAVRSDQGLICKEARLTRSMAIVRRADRVANPATSAVERELGRSLRSV